MFNFEAEIDFLDPKIVFSNPSPSLFEKKSFVIIDLDTSSGYGSAPNNIRSINKLTSNIPILVLDHHMDKKFLPSLLEAGASGIIPSTPNESNLTKAVGELIDGNKFFEVPE